MKNADEPAALLLSSSETPPAGTKVRLNADIRILPYAMDKIGELYALRRKADALKVGRSVSRCRLTSSPLPFLYSRVSYYFI